APPVGRLEDRRRALADVEHGRSGRLGPRAGKQEARDVERDRDREREEPAPPEDERGEEQRGRDEEERERRRRQVDRFEGHARRAPESGDEPLERFPEDEEKPV